MFAKWFNSFLPEKSNQFVTFHNDIFWVSHKNCADYEIELNKIDNEIYYIDDS